MTQEMLKLTKSSQKMMLVLIVLIKHHQLTYLLLDVSPHNRSKRTIGEKNATFHTFSKIVDKNCKVIADSESYINAISFKLLVNLKLKAVVLHPHLFKVSWIDSTTLRDQTKMYCPSQFQSL